MDAPLYLTLSARPPRLGVFVPMHTDMPWERCFEVALAAQTRLWGGSANLLFPAGDDLVDNELFWALADRLDADYFAAESFSANDLSTVNPAWFESWRDGLVGAMERDTPDVPVEGQRFIEEQSREPVFRRDIPDALMDIIERRLAPFHSQRELRTPGNLVVDDRRPPAESAQYPYADVTQLRNWPQRILNPTTTLGGCTSSSRPWRRAACPTASQTRLPKPASPKSNPGRATSVRRGGERYLETCRRTSPTRSR